MMRIALAVDESARAHETAARLRQSASFVGPEEADVVAVLGGDGFMLRTLHRYLSPLGGRQCPSFYGINCGTLGFLLNREGEGALEERIKEAEAMQLSPLKMVSTTKEGHTHHHFAINEVYLLRATYQSAYLTIRINGETQLEEMVGDGMLVSTPAGSTGYNFSAHGPILPLSCDLLALTPLNVFRPRHWRGALLPRTCRIDVEILDPSKRPVSAVADNQEVREVHTVSIEEAREASFSLLFDPGMNLNDKILREQFQNSCQKS